MARPSARPKLIDAALAVVEERGIAGLTLDAVADEAGVTKRGLIYHFPTKHDLLLGIHEDLAARTESQLLETTGREPEGATLVERTRGYVRAMLKAPSTVEMRLIMEASREPEWLAPGSTGDGSPKRPNPWKTSTTSRCDACWPEWPPTAPGHTRALCKLRSRRPHARASWRASSTR